MKRTVIYWITTALAIFVFASGGVMDLIHNDDVVAGMAHLGYPAYFCTVLGLWKILGALAIGAPGFPRLKEWAYAGMVFDLTGAACSHGASGDPVAKILTPLAIAIVVAASWALRPPARVLGTLA